MSDDLSKKFNLVPTPEKPDQITALSTEIASDSAKKDFATARASMSTIVEVASKGVNELGSLAFQTQTPDGYVALATMIKSATDAAQALLRIHKQLQELDKPNDNKDGVTPGSLHNHIHLGSMSTNDLKEALKTLRAND